MRSTWSDINAENGEANMKPIFMMLMATEVSLCLLSSRSLSAQERTSKPKASTERTLERPTTTGADQLKIGGTITYPDVACSIRAWPYHSAWDSLGNLAGSSEITDGTEVKGPVAILVRIRVTNSTSAPAKNVPLTVSMTASGKPVQQAKLNNPPANYKFYGTYPVPVATSVPLVRDSDDAWVGYEPLFPEGLGQLGRENTYVLTINARLDQYNSMKETNENNNECSKGIVIKYAAFP